VKRYHRLHEEISSKCLSNGWITKGHDLRSWIGGEGLPSRGHEYQGGERVEAATGGFQSTEDTQKSRIIQSLSYMFSIQICSSQCRQSGIYAVHKGLNHICLGKHVGTGSYSSTRVVRFVCSVQFS
jgi:hypothetical protein